MAMTSEQLRQKVQDALMQLAEETGEHPGAVLVEALAVSVMTLTAVCGNASQVREVYAKSAVSGDRIRRALARQEKLDRYFMEA